MSDSTTADLAPSDSPTDQTKALPAPWLKVAALDELAREGRMLIKKGRRQVALFHGPKGVFACNNRCPHEGYPLMEGSLTDGCVLTCNWHNWKFDLESGETLVGGDKLRRYPVRIEDGQVWIDPTDPSAEAAAKDALDNLRACFRRHEYDRMARELSRLALSGGDPLDAVRGAIAWTHDRLEFGATHAHAAAADWLTLRETHARDEAERLVPLLEIVGHLAWDTLREPSYPYAEGTTAYDADALVEAIDREDEPAAVALVRGALAAGLSFADVEPALARAALAHYADFGHSAIYVAKTAELAARLGRDSLEPLLLAQVRQLIYAWREDLIPEFRTYGEQLQAWNHEGKGALKPEDLVGLPAKRVMAKVAETGGDPRALYDALMGASAWNLLHYDTRYQERTEGPISQNFGWLGLTHAITFANAARVLCEKYPELWPAALLQMACFVGRGAGYVEREQDVSVWQVGDGAAFLDRALRGLFDHANPEYIVSAHLVKIPTAVRQEIQAAPEAPWVPTLLAALNRFLNSPIKRKHTLRTARQAIDFIELDG